MSVVVCTRNRPDALAACLDGLVAQRRKPDEVVVVDASDGEARMRVAVVAAAHAALPVRLLRSAAGLPRQRNVGVDASRGDVVVFLDDDAVPEPDHLAALARAYARDETKRVGGVGGVETPEPPPDSRARRLLNRLFLLPTDGAGHVKRSGRPAYLRRPAGEQDVEFLSGCNMSFRREVFAVERFDERLGGYALGEDLDFSFRVSRRWRLVVTPDARVLHRRAADGRPDPDAFQAMSVFNKYLFFRDRVARGPLDWLAYGWATAGSLLLRMRAPRRDGLRGALRGYAAIARHTWSGALPADADRGRAG